ncbi:Uncharacterized protein HZ326_12803 [Fusarium oxysporum f. sp. albedinis]|nr:Uncharacterized protein HZ326_12803 [Fusarium oxysporum f. sp. albedinis]
MDPEQPNCSRIFPSGKYNRAGYGSEEPGSPSQTSSPKQKPNKQEKSGLADSALKRVLYNCRSPELS